VSLAELAQVVSELRHRAETRPLEYWDPTPPQLAFLSDPSPCVLLRGANQIGKTACQMAEIIYRCTGRHPHKIVPRPPTECWIVVHSWEQSLSIQQKFWELAPKDLLDPSVEYMHGKGFRGKTPVVLWKNGSLLRFKTTNQGSLGLASSTISYVGLDEPPSARIWGELNARVLRQGQGGAIGLTLTPVGAPLGWLRQLVKDGVVSDHQAALTVENTTPIGGRPLVTQEQIDRIAKAYLPIDRAQRLKGAWEGLTTGRVFEAFNPETMVSDAPLPSLPRDGKPYSIAIGIDHGADAGSQVAILCAVDKSGEHPRIFVLDEYTAGAATADAHARAMLAMLHRNGMTHAHVDKWVGDRAYGGKRSGGRMSNLTLMKGLEASLGLLPGRLPFRIRTAWKPRFSVYHGAQVIHETMERDNFIVHPRCEQLIKSLNHWAFRDDENKHSIDALRYAAVTLIDDRIRMPVRIKMY